MSPRFSAGNQSVEKLGTLRGTFRYRHSGPGLAEPTVVQWMTDRPLKLGPLIIIPEACTRQSLWVASQAQAGGAGMQLIYYSILTLEAANLDFPAREGMISIRFRKQVQSSASSPTVISHVSTKSPIQYSSDTPRSVQSDDRSRSSYEHLLAVPLPHQDTRRQERKNKRECPLSRLFSSFWFASIHLLLARTLWR